MPRTQRNANFIDKTFGVIADILLQTLPTAKREKEAFDEMYRQWQERSGDKKKKQKASLF